MTPYLHAQILSCLSLIEFIVVDMGGDMFKRGYEFELDHNGCRSTLGIHIDQIGLDSAFSHDGLHLPGDVVELVVGWGGDLYGTLYFH